MKILIRIGLILLALMIALPIVGSVGTGMGIFTSGKPAGGVKFTDGDIAGMPVYPRAAQATLSGDAVTVPDDMQRVIPDDESQWKLYVTVDSPDAVVAWYQNAMVEAGFDPAQPRESDVWVFFKGSFRFGVHAHPAGGQTYIVQATGNE